MLNCMGTMSSRLYGGKRAMLTIQRTPSLRSSIAGETLCSGAAFRLVVLENLFESMEYCKKKTTRKYWRKMFMNQPVNSVLEEISSFSITTTQSMQANWSRNGFRTKN